MKAIQEWRYKKLKLSKRIDRTAAAIDEVCNEELTKITQKQPALGKTMVFVDLAGNEYGRDAMKKSGQANEKENQERIQINSDLFALQGCIRALHKNRPHIPYRDSTVTKYLKRYLGEEDSKAVMISTI